MQESWVQDPSDLSGFSRADAESGWQEALGHHESLESLHLPLRRPLSRRQPSVSPGPPVAGEVVFAAAEAAAGRGEQMQGNVAGAHGARVHAAGPVLISSEVLYRDRAAFSAAAARPTPTVTQTVKPAFAAAAAPPPRSHASGAGVPMASADHEQTAAAARPPHSYYTDVRHLSYYTLRAAPKV